MNDDDKTISRAGMLEKLAVAPIAIGAFISAKSNPMKSPGACKLVKIVPIGYCKFLSPKAH